MLGRHAQFDPMVMRIPQLPTSERKSGANAAGEYELRIKREGEWTRVFYPWNPMNASGWKGDLAPWALNVDDIRALEDLSPLPDGAGQTYLQPLNMVDAAEALDVLVKDSQGGPTQ